MAERRRFSEVVHPREARAPRGWRLELGLGLLVGLLGHLAYLAMGPSGDVLVIGSAWLLWTGSERLRGWLCRRLREASRWRVFIRLLQACRVDKRVSKLPRLVAITEVPLGVSYRLVVKIGSSVDELAPIAPRLAVALRAREVRLVRDRDDASRLELLAIYRSAFRAGEELEWAWRHRSVTSLFEAVPVGIGEDRRPVTVGLLEHNLLVGGEPGAGKSVVLSLFVAAAALDTSVSLSLLDAKQVELAPWRGCAEAFVGPDMEAAIEVLSGLRSEMDRRYGYLLRSGRRKITPGGTMGLHLVVIDELAYYLRAEDRTERQGFTEAMRDLVSRGRAAGIIVVAATQKPSHDVVPTAIRDLFSYRLALRCTSKEASDTILGQGWAANGFSASVIDPANRGVGLLLAEGETPVQVKAAYLSDADIAELALRAGELRAGDRR